MNSIKSSLGWALLALALPLSGCLTYQPQALQATAPGQEVRVRFAAPRDVDIGSVTVRDVTFVDGSVLEITDNGPTILVDWVQSEAGTRHRSLGDRVRVAEGELATIETERVEAGKTAALVVGGAAAFAGVMFAIFNSDTSASGDQPGPGETPNPFSLVLTRLLLPF